MKDFRRLTYFCDIALDQCCVRLQNSGARPLPVFKCKKKYVTSSLAIFRPCTILTPADNEGVIRTAVIEPRRRSYYHVYEPMAPNTTLVFGT